MRLLLIGRWFVSTAHVGLGNIMMLFALCLAGLLPFRPLKCNLHLAMAFTHALVSTLNRKKPFVWILPPSLTSIVCFLVGVDIE